MMTVALVLIWDTYLSPPLAFAAEFPTPLRSKIIAAATVR